MKHIRSTFFLLTTLFIMASCGEDRSGEYYALVGENLWIEQIMKEHYLWYDSIPAIKETDYFAEPENFLQKLVYTMGSSMADDESSFALMPCADGDSRKYENPNGVACLLQVKNRLVEPQMDEASNIFSKHPRGVQFPDNAEHFGP